MRRFVLGFAVVSLVSAMLGCQGPCTNCGGRAGLFGHHQPRDPAHMAAHGGARSHSPVGGHHYRPPTEPAGGPVPQYAYPYYTLRGPRDFLVDNPPSIGPY